MLQIDSKQNVCISIVLVRVVAELSATKLRDLGKAVGKTGLYINKNFAFICIYRKKRRDMH